MLYYSTRDTIRKHGISSAEAILKGIADDGGLYMPETIPAIGPEFIKMLSGLDYKSRAVKAGYTVVKTKVDYKSKKDRKSGEIIDEWWMVEVTVSYEI